MSKITWFGTDWDNTVQSVVPGHERHLRKAILEVAAGDKYGMTGDKLEKLRSYRRHPGEGETEYAARIQRQSDLYVKISQEAQVVTAKRHLKEGARERVVGTLERLAEDYKLAVVTNSKWTYLEPASKAVGIPLSLFNVIVAGGDVIETKRGGAQFIHRDVAGLKPTIQPFKWLIEYTANPPSQHAYAGDSEVMDIIPANSAGMRTIKVGGRKSKRADANVARFVDIPPAIRRLGR